MIPRHKQDIATIVNAINKYYLKVVVTVIAVSLVYLVYLATVFIDDTNKRSRYLQKVQICDNTYEFAKIYSGRLQVSSN